MVLRLAQEVAAAARLVDVMAADQGHDAAVLRVALDIAATSIRAFPCAPRGKSPLTRHGFKEATTSANQIGRWFSRRPDANLAIATGGTGVDVLDIDCHPSGTGFAALERIRRVGLTDGWSMIVRTPSGGLHFYYPARADRPQRSWSLGESHVDFRGVGGYVLVPPSSVQQRDGGARAYRVIAVGREPKPLDAEAIKAFLRPRKPVLPRGVVTRRGPNNPAERLAAWMTTRPEGTRNGSLFWAASRLAEQQIPEHEAHGGLLDSAVHAGLPETEAVATIRSAYRRAGAAPSSGGMSR